MRRRIYASVHYFIVSDFFKENNNIIHKPIKKTEAAGETEKIFETVLSSRENAATETCGILNKSPQVKKLTTIYSNRYK